MKELGGCTSQILKKVLMHSTTTHLAPPKEQALDNKLSLLMTDHYGKKISEKGWGFNFPTVTVQ